MRECVSECVRKWCLDPLFIWLNTTAHSITKKIIYQLYEFLCLSRLVHHFYSPQEPEYFIKKLLFHNRPTTLFLEIHFHYNSISIHLHNNSIVLFSKTAQDCEAL